MAGSESSWPPAERIAGERKEGEGARVCAIYRGERAGELSPSPLASWLNEMAGIVNENTPLLAGLQPLGSIVSSSSSKSKLQRTTLLLG